MPFLERLSLNDYQIPDPSGKGTLTLKGGTGVYTPVYAMHHDPEYFPQPDKYDPERFSDENKDSIAPFSYLPFGEGPRNCLGECHLHFYFVCLFYLLL